jgi:hypothetical protein
VDESSRGTPIRIYVGGNDRSEKLPFYEALVLKAREDGLAWAKVLRGMMDYGRGSVVYTAKISSLSALTTLVKVRILSRQSPPSLAESPRITAPATGTIANVGKMGGSHTSRRISCKGQ